MQLAAWYSLELDRGELLLELVVLLVLPLALPPLLAPLLEAEFGEAAGNTTLPAAVYSLIMFMTGAALMTFFGRRDDSAEDAEAAAEAA